MTRTFPLHLPSAAPAKDSTRSTPSLLTRITRGLRRALAAMMDARRRQADREVAFYLARHGMKFTDATEREIEHLLVSPHAFHRD